MNNVEFLEQSETQNNSQNHPDGTKNPAMIRTLIRTGLAENEKQAMIILVLIIIFSFTTTFLLINKKNDSESNIIIDAQGNSYTLDEYMSLVQQGKDPLLPK